MSEALHVIVATPLGRHGKGGIDRLNDSIFEGLAGARDMRLTRLVTRGQWGLGGAFFVFAFALARFAAIALFGKVDLVHIHLSIKGSAYRKTLVGAMARLFRIPYVVHLHGIDFREFWAGAPPRLASAVTTLFAKSACVVVMGRYWADVISERLPEIALSIVILPNASPAPARMAPAQHDARVRVTFLGKVGARKGTPVLIDALDRLRGRADWRATIAGDGDVDASRRTVRQLGLADRIELPGWLEVEAREDLWARTDVLVLPSTAENLPMVIMEALLRGKVVVATPVGAIPEVIEDGENGLLVPVGDADALARALARLIGDAALRARLGAAARRAHETKYDFGVYLKALTAIWRSASAQQSVSLASPSEQAGLP